MKLVLNWIRLATKKGCQTIRCSCVLNGPQLSLISRPQKCSYIISFISSISGVERLHAAFSLFFWPQQDLYPFHYSFSIPQWNFNSTVLFKIVTLHTFWARNDDRPFLFSIIFLMLCTCPLQRAIKCTFHTGNRKTFVWVLSKDNCLNDSEVTFWTNSQYY